MQAAPATTAATARQAARQPRCRLTLARLVLAALLVPLAGALHRHGHPASLGGRPILSGARAAATGPKAALPSSKGHRAGAAAAGEESGEWGRGVSRSAAFCMGLQRGSALLGGACSHAGEC